MVDFINEKKLLLDSRSYLQFHSYIGCFELLYIEKDSGYQFIINKKVDVEAGVDEIESNLNEDAQD